MIPVGTLCEIVDNGTIDVLERPWIGRFCTVIGVLYRGDAYEVDIEIPPWCEGVHRSALRPLVPPPPARIEDRELAHA